MTEPVRLDNARTIRAPRGPERSCRSWQSEAALRMLMNNLDPDVAEHPEALVVYGGIGRAARNWEAFDRIAGLPAPSRRGRNAAGAIRQAGGHLPHPRRRAARADRQFQPGAALGDLGALQRTRPPRPDDVRADDRRLLDLHRQPGHRARHLRDVLRGRAAALRRRSGRPMDSHRRPRRHGRRAAARGNHGGRVAVGGRMPAEPAGDAPAHRLSRSPDRRSGRGARLDRGGVRGAACDVGRPARQRS